MILNRLFSMVRTSHFVLASIICIASFIRLYELGSVPHGLTWDEAAIGYNGFAILTTRRDEWLIRLPVSFKSFGDFKAATAIYSNGIFTYLFGLNIYAVRLPFALSGIASVVVFYFFCKRIFFGHLYQEQFSLLGTFLLSISPWHIHFSRIAFETGMSFFFVLTGLTLLLYFLHISATAKSVALWGVLNLSALSFTLGLYAYHSAKIVVPLLFILVFTIYFKTVKKILFPYIIGGLAVLGVLLIPLIKDTIVGNAAQRAGVLFIFDDISILQMVVLFFKNFFVHILPGFMIMGDTITLRHGPGAWSVLLPILYLLCCFGLVTLIIPHLRNKIANVQPYLFGFGVTIIGILPAALSYEVPHSNRAFLALPGLIILGILGIESIQVLSRNFKSEYKEWVFKIILGLLLTLEVFFFISFIHYYFVVFARNSTAAFQEGYIEAMTIAKDYEKGANGRPEVANIIVDGSYGQPYIYALFVRKTDPFWYQGGSLQRYHFTNKVTITDFERPSALLVAAPNDTLPLERADHLIFGSDGTLRFALFYTGHK